MSEKCRNILLLLSLLFILFKVASAIMFITNYFYILWLITRFSLLICILFKILICLRKFVIDVRISLRLLSTLGFSASSLYIERPIIMWLIDSLTLRVSHLIKQEGYLSVLRTCVLFERVLNLLSRFVFYGWTLHLSSSHRSYKLINRASLRCILS